MNFRGINNEDKFFAIPCSGRRHSFVECLWNRAGGQYFDLQQFTANVKHGITTREEVRAWLGAPSSMGVAVDSKGIQTKKWTYYYGSGSVSDMKQAHLKYLELQFSQDGRLVAYNWSK